MPRPIKEARTDMGAMLVERRRVDHQLANLDSIRREGGAFPGDLGIEIFDDLLKRYYLEKELEVLDQLQPCTRERLIELKDEIEPALKPFIDRLLGVRNKEIEARRDQIAKSSPEEWQRSLAKLIDKEDRRLRMQFREWNMKLKAGFNHYIVRRKLYELWKQGEYLDSCKSKTCEELIELRAIVEPEIEPMIDRLLGIPAKPGPPKGKKSLEERMKIERERLQLQIYELADKKDSGTATFLGHPKFLKEWSCLTHIPPHTRAELTDLKEREPELAPLIDSLLGKKNATRQTGDEEISSILTAKGNAKTPQDNEIIESIKGSHSQEKQAVDVMQEKSLPANEAGLPDGTSLPHEGYMTYREIAKKFGIKKMDALRKRLDRWERSDPSAKLRVDVVIKPDHNRGECLKLYRLSAVMPIVDKMLKNKSD